MRQVDAGGLSEAHQIPVKRQVVDPYLAAERVKEDVAGMHDAAVHGKRAMPRFPPAVLVAAIQRHAAGTVHAPLLIHGPSLQTHQRDDGLERGSRRLLGLNRPVQHGMFRIIGDLAPVLGLDAHRKLVGIEGGAGDHGEHLTRPRIERHHRAILALHGQFRHGLQIQIDGRLQVFTFHRLLRGKGLAYLPAIVHHHLALPVHAHQRVVVLLLDAELAHHVALVVFGKLRRVQFLLADFAGVPDDVRQRTVLRIEAARSLNQYQFRKEIVMRSHEGEIRRREFILDGGGDVFGLGANPLHAPHQVVVIQV